MFDKLGLQLYTVRDYLNTEEDMDKTFERLVSMGYTVAQSAGHESEAMAKLAKKHGIIMDVLVEINSGAEESKSGVLPEELEAFCNEIETFENINHRGFMTMAPKCEKKEEYLKYFQQTYQQVLDIWAKKRHNISKPVISMGMSDSFEEAILCGSDIVRVGRRLFIK